MSLTVFLSILVQFSLIIILLIYITLKYNLNSFFSKNCCQIMPKATASHFKSTASHINNVASKDAHEPKYTASKI